MAAVEKKKHVIDFTAIQGLSRDIVALSSDIVGGLATALPKLVGTVTMESLVMAHADAKREIFFANDGFLQMTGYSFGEVIGRNCAFLQGERTDQRVVRQMREAMNTFHPVRVEIVNYRKDGTPFVNEISIFPVFKAGTSVPFCLVGVQNPRCFGYGSD